MAIMQSWFTKACNMLSSTWHSQGAPDSDEMASEEFLKQLSTEYAARLEQDAVKPEWPVPPSQQTTSITVDDEDFDCRVGKRAQKRRREAKTVGDSKQKPSGAKGEGVVLHGLTNLLQRVIPKAFKPKTALSAAYNEHRLSTKACLQALLLDFIWRFASRKQQLFPSRMSIVQQDFSQLHDLRR